MKKIILFLLAASISHNVFADYDGPGSPTYTQRQEEAWRNAQQQANANATAQGWMGTNKNSLCGTNGCINQPATNQTYGNPY